MDGLAEELAEEAAEAEGPLRAALQYAVGEIVRAEAAAEGDDAVAPTGVTVACMAHMAFLFTKAAARDLQAFARHAKRSTVGCEDVKLMALRAPRQGTPNTALAALEQFEKENCSAPAKGRQRRKASTAAAAATGGGGKKRAKAADEAVDASVAAEADDVHVDDDDDDNMFEPL
eukprot:TRINITY_DN30199_c0_g1_i1.p3 TRINITY_DN30199_c0_g1~~TRINITY_DN30199_c0_g1_i1.p3  ORF type:complete len:174 (-),score=78.74 TRINITY_DN30199_c0_g1_i1:26-547(-)